MPRRATILLVDDDDADLMIAARRLRSSSSDRYRLLQASNLDEAMATLKVSPVDAVVLDLNLGTSTGPETVALLRGEAETPFIIAVTGHASPELERACLEAGADQFIDKDTVASGSELMHALEFALRQPRPKSQTLASHARALLGSVQNPGSSDLEGITGLEGNSSGRLHAAARKLAAHGRPPTELFAHLLEEATGSRDPSLTLGALAVYLAQEYFDTLGRDP